VTTTSKGTSGAPRILSLSKVAEMFGVHPKTVTRWARSGKLPAGHRTLGGHRRWYEDEILEALNVEAR
jgi:excisionase family DNA binding protein